IASLRQRGLLTRKEAEEATERVWNRTETTKTTSEPILRLHTKLLLIAFALIPLGSALFEVPRAPVVANVSEWAALLEALWTPRNQIALFLLALPLLLLGLLGLINIQPWCTKPKWLLFGKDHDANFSVLNFFFNRVQGTVERKRIKSPQDSIAEFRSIFAYLIDRIHAHAPRMRVVIIIDNIDRIPPSQARDFWSTMQTFFADGGGLRRPANRKYWLVAPFSIEALSFVFAESGSIGDSKEHQA